MEPISIASVTLASILSSLPSAGEPVSQSVISTHISPEIAGQWEIELQPPASHQELKATSHNRDSDNNDHNTMDLEVISTDENTDQWLLKSASETVIKPSEQSTAVKTKSSCRELYNFGEDNNVWAVSGAEWTYGKYLVTHPEQGLPIIAIKTLYDNNEVDCSGNQVDQTDEALVAYLNYDDKHMQWCSDPEGNECFMKFHRILP
ncbi:MAG: hypothetical protein Q4P13_10275 [Psychrobacter sp.]|nr:hypothetical protein [Psychrobacter sp.]